MPEFVTDVVEEFVQKERTRATGPRGPRERTPEQKEWDEAFSDAYADRGFIAVQVKPEDADAAKSRIMSSARLYDLAVTEGEPRPGQVEGTVILSWRIRRPVKRGPRAPKAVTAEAPE